MVSYRSTLSHCLCFVNRSPDDVHDLMDDIQDQQEVSDEITNALATGLGHNEDIDEVSLIGWKQTHLGETRLTK